MGSERPLGGSSLHKRESRERRRAHGVRDAVSEGPIPLPPRLRISRFRDKAQYSLFAQEGAVGPADGLGEFQLVEGGVDVGVGEVEGDAFGGGVFAHGDVLGD